MVAMEEIIDLPLSTPLRLVSLLTDIILTQQVKISAISLSLPKEKKYQATNFAVTTLHGGVGFHLFSHFLKKDLLQLVSMAQLFNNIKVEFSQRDAIKIITLLFWLVMV
jgi:hypothetical protein